ncbi:MAG: alpha/beta hydrolase [Pseudomonadota bacterium]
MPNALKAGFDTYWTTFGQGSRQALMIHCGLSHSGAWRGMARHLSGAMTMMAFDMPGHGRSGAWDGRAELQGFTAEIGLDLLAEPAHLIGHSFGATVALRMAIMRPEMVLSLVLIEPVFFAVAAAENSEVAREIEELFSSFNDSVLRDDMHAAAEAFLGIWGDGSDWKTIPKQDQDRLAGQMHLIVASGPALHQDVGGMLAPGVLTSLTIPTLLLEGACSPRVVNQINGGLAARLPSSSRAIISGASHMVPITHPKQVSAEILRFQTQL